MPCNFTESLVSVNGATATVSFTNNESTGNLVVSGGGNTITIEPGESQSIGLPFSAGHYCRSIQCPDGSNDCVDLTRKTVATCADLIGLDISAPVQTVDVIGFPTEPGTTWRVTHTTAGNRILIMDAQR